METLAYVYSAVAYEDAPAQELVSSSDDELVFEGINWKKFSSRACLYLLPVAVAFGSLGIASQAQARTTSDYRTVATSSVPNAQWDTAVDVNSLVAPEAKTAESVNNFQQVGYYYQSVGYYGGCNRRHYRHSCYRPRRHCYKRCYWRPVVVYQKVCYRHRPYYQGCYRPRYRYSPCYRRRHHYNGCYRRRHYYSSCYRPRYRYHGCYRPRYQRCYRSYDSSYDD